MKQLSFLIILCALFYPRIYAQEKPCAVAMEEITGTYTGDCVKGKANGKGKSVGTDQYEGDFKDGYPDGKGMYVWKDGHYFIGFYKKGNKEGKGDMYYESASGDDSVITGYWKKDKYIGQYEKQFVVISTTSGIYKVDCKLIDKTGDNLMFTVHQKSSSSSLYYTAPVAYVSNVSIVSGNFYTTNHQVLNNNSISRVQQVTFPFRAIFSLSNGESAEIQFNEKGNYDIYIDAQ